MNPAYLFFSDEQKSTPSQPVQQPRLLLHLEIQEQGEQMDEADRLERWRIRGLLKAFEEYLCPRRGPPPFER